MDNIDWKEYQERVAEVFRGVGAEAIVNHMVKGARGKHNLDVWVSQKNFGVEMIWVCECKYWKSSIPKEKVLTLYEIVKDIGADRGFLFSESGFQSGAIRSTNNTNITLTSLDEIADLIRDDLQHLILMKFLKQMASIRGALKKCWTDDMGNARFIEGVAFDECLSIDGNLMFQSLNAQKALNDNWPIFIQTFSRGTISCTNLEGLNKVLVEEMKELEIKAAEIQQDADIIFNKIRSLRSVFITAIFDLIEFGEIQLYNNNQSYDDKSGTTVSKMKKVGEVASELKPLIGGSFSRKMNEIMKALIDTIYLHLTKIDTDRDEWDKSVEIISEQMKVLVQIEKV